MEPEVLGKYTLIDRLGSGGMAEVFLARTSGPGGFLKSVALKRIHPHLAADQEFVDMFVNEARVAAQLDHPNIAQIHELGCVDGTWFIAMELVDGPSLRALCERALERKVRVPFGVAARIAADACQGLAFAHEYVQDGRWLKLIHRDVNPDNILLSRAGVVKIADFGVARAAANQRRTRVGMIRGKVTYMPPEQLCDRDIDGRADVFALGVTLYEVLAGALPFQATNDERMMDAIIKDPAIPLPLVRLDCPVELWAIVQRALAKDRAARFPDCRVFQRELERFLVSRREIATAHDVAQFVFQLFPEGDASLSLPLENRATEQRAASRPPERVTGEPTILVERPGPPITEPAAGPAASVAAPAPGSPPRRLLVPALVGLGAVTVLSFFAVRGLSAMGALGRDAGAVAEAPDVGGAAVEAPLDAAVAGERPDAAQPGPDAGPLVVAWGADARRTGTLVVESARPCVLSLDDRLVGPVPVTLTKVPRGVRRLSCAVDATVVLQVAARVTAGETRTESLQFPTGYIDLHVQPWAEVELDGRPLGRTPFPEGLEVVEGEHVLKLRNPELKKPRTLKVKVRAGAREIVPVLLTSP